ncbi:hypothetical protein K503DRAFT_769674 [Rhizopogon vinicolor AM-OR11-026]|uniref:Uncharacterized protein n=1 Tax=Rhizopogon vinicolor AM-OR11-026 TaxID=1314800 RepID=A0A1B7N335_9AGAM|nr:hypothetical protein K503DRAFT_769674 [Rhizopogon vinicolor AM-OR11-026]
MTVFLRHSRSATSSFVLSTGTTGDLLNSFSSASNKVWHLKLVKINIDEQHDFRHLLYLCPNLSSLDNLGGSQ